jgi:hypothetical protein
MWGIVKLFCPICGAPILYNGNLPSTTLHHKEFGIVCGKQCHEEAEKKYVRMIMGKDEL